MKFVKYFSTVLMVLMIFLSSSQPVSAENWKNLQILNRTGKTIDELWFKPACRSDWGGETLKGVGLLYLENDKYATIRYNANHNNWDMKIIFIDGKEAVWIGDHVLGINGAYRITISKTDTGYSVGADSANK